MAQSGLWTTSLTTELLFMILTSWAPIWIYSCGLTDRVKEREELGSLNGILVCATTTCKYGWYLLGYIIWYTLIIIYFTEDNPHFSLLNWIAVIYGGLLLIQLSTICSRRMDSDMEYRNLGRGKMKYRRHRFSLVGRAKDHIRERKRILESRKRNLQRQPSTKKTRRQIKRIETQIERLDGDIYEDDWSSDEDNFETAREIKV